MKVFFDTVGCRLNQAEIEMMAARFRAAGYVILDAPDMADIVIVNSCTVTAAAASDSRQKIRQAHEAGAKEILFTGCLATLEPTQSKLLPGVSLVISNENKQQIPELVLNTKAEVKLDIAARQPLPGSHKKTRAYIKVQDGCNNFCTFCITRLARGRSISQSKEDILAAIRFAEAGGVHEVVLSGVNLGAWGKDYSDRDTLAGLIRFLLENSTIERIRLSSVEPWDLDETFFDLWQDKRMCRQLHLPLQSGSASVLQRMARKTTPERFRELVQLARRKAPGLAITTDIIVGFPGETEDEFMESLKFTEEMNFSGGHVFRYSSRPGTPASKLDGAVHGKESSRRSRMMREVFLKSSEKFTEQFIGKELTVLWERAQKCENNSWRMTGLTDNYIKVSCHFDENRSNQLDPVKLISSLSGEADAVFTNHIS